MRIFGKLGLALAAAAATGACVPRRAPPAPMPAPRPLPPPPPPAAAPPPADWQAGPLSPGDWSYVPGGDTPLATFQSDRLAFTIRCERRASVGIALAGAQAPALAIRTSYGERRLPVRAVDTEMRAELPPSDPLLDQMAFSRGRFLVEVEGGPALVVPAWPELARVVEDCRG